MSCIYSYQGELPLSTAYLHVVHSDGLIGYMDFSKAVRALRGLTGDSQQAFAARLGLSIRAIANYEKDRVPTGRALYQLSQLARELGREDFAKEFSSALSAEFEDVIEPLNPEEKVWPNAVFALVRTRD